MRDEPIDPHARIVVIGAGQAGFTACAKLRDLGHQGPITLIGEEAHPPYQRPPLSKGYLLGEITEDRLYFRSLSFYEERSIDLRLSVTASAIDRDSKVVALADGNVIAYDRLILTTGARPRTLPAAIGGNLDGVFCVRNLADINAMAGRFLEGRRVLIVGGGYIGLEAAAVSAKLGLKVTVIEAAPRILQRVACPETAAYFRALHDEKGVTLLEGAALEALEGDDGHVCLARLVDGSVVPVDFVIAGVGVVPNVELAEAAGFTIDNGIAVDDTCRTSDPDIYAAGDCTSFPWRTGRIRLESVGNAIEQAEAVARSLTGTLSKYDAKPWFWSDQYDTKLQIAGLSAGYDSVATRVGSAGGMSYWYYRGKELLAVDAMNEPRVYMVAKRLIEAGRSPSAEVVSDPATDLKALLS